jgi:Zn-dependent protease
MRIPIQHPAFKSKGLSVEPASFFSGPKLLLDGVAVKKQKGRYPVVSDSGQQVLIQVRYNLLDPIPTVKIGDAAVELAKPLQWFEYAWIGVPMLLVFAGGALGGFVGAGSTVVNGRIFRSDRSAVSKYALAAVTSITGAAIFLVLAVAISMAVGPRK